MLSCYNITFILTFSSTLVLVTVLLSCLTGSLSFVFMPFIFSAFHFASYFLCSFSFLLPPFRFLLFSHPLSLFLFQSLTPHNPSHSVSLFIFPLYSLFLSLFFPHHSLAFFSHSFSICISLYLSSPLPPLSLTLTPIIFFLHMSFINPHCTSVLIYFSLLQSQNHSISDTPPPSALTLIIKNDILIRPHIFYSCCLSHFYLLPFPHFSSISHYLSFT